MMSRRCGRQKDARKRFIITCLSDRNILLALRHFIWFSFLSTFSSSILSYLHMPFLRPSTRPQSVQCFFCLSPSLLPPRPHASSPPTSPDRKGKGRIAEPGTKWNWQCERCGCWNIRDNVRILPFLVSRTIASDTGNRPGK